MNSNKTKILVVILSVIVLIVSVLCSCSPKTIPEGYEKICDIIEKNEYEDHWMIEADGLFREIDNETGEEKYYCIIKFYATRSFESLKEAVNSAEDATDHFYSKVKNAFGKFEVNIGFEFYSASNHFIVGAVDGDLITQDISTLLQGTWTHIGPSSYIDITLMNGNFIVELNWSDGKNIVTIKGTYTINESENEVLLVQSTGYEYGTFSYAVQNGEIFQIVSVSNGDVYIRKK